MARNNFTVTGDVLRPIQGRRGSRAGRRHDLRKLDLGFDITVYARVRVLGINAPENSTPAGRKRLHLLRVVLPVGSEVSVTSYGWDKYGGRVDGKL
jgi:hypothetical protein